MTYLFSQLQHSIEALVKLKNERYRKEDESSLGDINRIRRILYRGGGGSWVNNPIVNRGYSQQPLVTTQCP